MALNITAIERRITFREAGYGLRLVITERNLREDAKKTRCRGHQASYETAACKIEDRAASVAWAIRELDIF